MKKRVIAFLGAMMLLFGSLTCFAVETRASHYFDGYMLGVSAKGNLKMNVSFCVMGTGEMDQIGAYSIRIEEEVGLGTDNWITTFTAYGDDDTDNFYSYNTNNHLGEFSFYGSPGINYRAVLVAYAKNESGEEYSREITCTGKVCK